MPKFNIVVFAGDYAGPEVTAEAVKVSADLHRVEASHTRSSVRSSRVTLIKQSTEMNCHVSVSRTLSEFYAIQMKTPSPNFLRGVPY